MNGSSRECHSRLIHVPNHGAAQVPLAPASLDDECGAEAMQKISQAGPIIEAIAYLATFLAY
jgi:hypothetical protein